ncbi:MAG: diguanylate cyclase, partial [Caproiciproducens sp.]|nr:diguanylate cyclase [Caproiciproducens sp.]
MDFKSTQNLMDFMLNFDKLFDIIRVVDPVSKRIVQYYQKDDDSNGAVCYEYWKNGVHCPNCVSSRAANENDTFLKIEYNKDKIYMVMASPAKLTDKRCVVEMLKDITETGIVPDLKGKTIEEINDIIAQLNKEVITDELTKVFNRRYLNERLPVDIYDAAVNKTKLSVIMLDVDCFKVINDTYGHVAGDTVLRELCATVQSNIREGHDWLARFGGEEFLISLPGADQNAAGRIAEKIRAAVESKEIQCEEKKINVTVSVG